MNLVASVASEGILGSIKEDGSSYFNLREEFL